MIKRIFCLVGLILLLITSVHGQVITSLPTGMTTTVYDKTLAVENSSSFATPGQRAIILNWSVDYTGSPASITLNIQGSNDNITWFTLATTSVVTDTGGDLGPTASKFLRVNIAAVTGAVNALIKFNVFGFNNPAAYSGGVLTSRLGLTDGTEALPSLYFNTAPTKGLYLFNSASIGFSGNILAGVDNTYDLGAAANALKDLYVDGRQFFGGITFAALGTPANGTLVFCTDCTIANPCAGVGTGAFAKRLNGVWVCN